MLRISRGFFIAFAALGILLAGPGPASAQECAGECEDVMSADECQSKVGIIDCHTWIEEPPYPPIHEEGPPWDSHDGDGYGQESCIFTHNFCDWGLTNMEELATSLATYAPDAAESILAQHDGLRVVVNADRHALQVFASCESTAEQPVLHLPLSAEELAFWSEVDFVREGPRVPGVLRSTTASNPR
jgi:hypothetical protein